MRIPKKKILIIGAVLITSLNIFRMGAAYYWYPLDQPTGDTQDIVAAEAPKIEVKSSEQDVVSTDKQGIRIGEGQYKIETLDKSKIDEGAPANLSVLSHEASGAHFVLAINKSQSLASQISAGWKESILTSDPLWSPGACASKPTYLIQGKYVFIDDGKTKPTDAYNSFIVYNFETKKYNYFGGDNFTDTQAKNEKILSAKYENDQLVFYIDPNDATGPLKNSETFKHATGSDKAYIIRRVVDPENMSYVDYTLPFKVPKNITYYFVSAGYGENIVMGLSEDGGQTRYDGKVENNAIKLTKFVLNLDYTNKSAPPTDSPIELDVNPLLVKALPDFTDQTAYPNSTYTGLFEINKLGSVGNLEFLISKQRYGKDGGKRYDTAVVYDSQKKSVDVMLTKLILNDYVPLGVY